MMKTFSVEDAIKLLDGLVKLDGYDRPIKDGANERSIRELYKFRGGLRLLIARNMVKLRAVSDVFQAARNGLVREFADNSGSVPMSNMGAFLNEENEILKAPQQIELAEIVVRELKLDVNPIPASVLALIDPLLVEE